MKLIVQRVKNSSVTVGSEVVGQIGNGALILLGVAKTDSEKEADYLVNKLINLRMYEDDGGNLNLSGKDVGAQFLVVSQFTIYGDCTKGRRPSFDKAADPELAERLYTYFIEKLKETGHQVESGTFRAMMDVQLVNDGPVTFILESH